MDRKIDFRFSPKTALALKLVREQLTTIMSLRMRGKTLDETQLEWFSLAVQILKHAKLEGG